MTDEYEETLEVEFSSEPSGGQGDLEISGEGGESEISDGPGETIDELLADESVGELSDGEDEDKDEDELLQVEPAASLIERGDEAVEPDVSGEPVEGDDEALGETAVDGVDYDGPGTAGQRRVAEPVIRPVVGEPTAESVVEAILFASDEPLTAERLGKIVETGVKQVRKHVESLNEKYASNNNSFRIERIAGGYQMLTLGEYNHWLRKLLRARGDSRLSPAALETLAIIAYKQPIIRADIEAIRGVAAGEMIRGLMYKGLVKIVGRAEVLGRPMLYGTAKKFLEVFGLNSLKDLPKVEELKKPAS